MYSLYIHICPNKKVYIGITSKRPEERWKNGSGYLNNKHFYAAIKKYGWDNIEHKIIFNNLSKEDACRLESEYIAKYDSTNRKKGYNNSVGGENPSKGFKHTEEAKRKIGIASRNRIVKPESIEKIRLKRIKAVDVYDLEMNLIRTYESATEAEKATGISNSNIIACCKGRYSQFKGYIFTYAGEKPCKCKRSHRKPVDMYSLDGEFLKRFETIKAAARELKIPDTHISDCCKGKYSQSGGYVWKYVIEQ